MQELKYILSDDRQRILLACFERFFIRIHPDRLNPMLEQHRQEVAVATPKIDHAAAIGKVWKIEILNLAHGFRANAHIAQKVVVKSRKAGWLSQFGSIFACGL